MLVYRIDLGYDEEAKKFFVVRSDIPGLHAEAETLAEMQDIVCDLAPELFEANRVSPWVHAQAFLRGLSMPNAVKPRAPRNQNSHVNLRISQFCSA